MVKSFAMVTTTHFCYTRSWPKNFTGADQ